MQTQYLLANNTVNGVSIVRDLGELSDSDASKILHEAQQNDAYSFPFIMSRSEAWRKHRAEMRSFTRRINGDEEW